MSTKHIEALKLALEGAANYIDALGGDSRKYRQALAEKPAQPQQEPVAWIDPKHLEWLAQSPDNLTGAGLAARQRSADMVPLYTAPPASKPWVGLTEEEVDDLSREMVKGNKSVNWLAHAIEAKLREKNT